jgi:dGTPase
MINELVMDLVDESRRRIGAAAPGSADAVRERSEPLIAFSEPAAEQAQQVKRFLFANLYRHSRVVRMTSKARRIVTELFAAFIDDVRLLPEDHQRRAQADAPRAIADYIAGMTDRYAIKEYRRLFVVDDR